MFRRDTTRNISVLLQWQSRVISIQGPFIYLTYLGLLHIILIRLHIVTAKMQDEFFLEISSEKSSNFIASNNITVKWRHFRVIIITLWSRSKDPAKADFMFSLCWGEEYIPTVTFLFAVLKINYFVYFPISTELFLNLNEETWEKKSKFCWPDIQDWS